MKTIQYKETTLTLQLDKRNAYTYNLSCNGKVYDDYLEGEDQLDWLLQYMPLAFTEFLDTAIPETEEVQYKSGITQEQYQKMLQMDKKYPERGYIRKDKAGNPLPIEQQA